MTVFFKANTKSIERKSPFQKVGRVGYSLFPAIAAAFLDAILCKKISDKNASFLLKQYYTAYPQEKRSFSQMGAIEQWKSMMRHSGATSMTAIKMIKVLDHLAFETIRKSPMQYCKGMEAIDNFDENIAFQSEKTIYLALLKALSDVCGIGIELHIVDGPKSMRARILLSQNDNSDVCIQLNMASSEFYAKLQQAHRFENMPNRPELKPVAIECDLGLFLAGIFARYEETLERYKTMYAADEITKAQMIDQYIEGLRFDAHHRWAINPGNALKNVVHPWENSDIPEDTYLLMTALSWKEAITQEHSLYHFEENLPDKASSVALA